MSSAPGMTEVTCMTRWDSSLAYCCATLRIAMMTSATMLVVIHAVEHVTIPMQEMISTTDMRICATLPQGKPLKMLLQRGIYCKEDQNGYSKVKHRGHGRVSHIVLVESSAAGDILARH